MKHSDILRSFNRLNIKWRIFIYLVGFTAIMVLLLWLFQIVFLDNFYKAIKVSGIQSAAKTLEKNIDSDEIQDLVDSIATENNFCIRIISPYGVGIASRDITPDCLIHKLPLDKVLEYAYYAQENGGSDMQYLDYIEHFGGEPGRIGGRLGGEFDLGPNGGGFTRKQMESIVYTQLVTMEDGTPVIILLNTVITPINATVGTLKVQLLYITAVLIVLALLIALLMAKQIAAPLSAINQSAKQLAGGNYDVRFQGEGYLEVWELSSTLNYAATELGKVEGLRRELIANISHDLRTPLTMITGYAEVMRDLPGENTPENVQIIIDESKRLTTLVNDMLDISKLQAGTQELTKSTFNLTQSLFDILNRYSKFIEQNGFEIHLTHDRDAFVQADEPKIGQVFYNLMNNAINYTGADKKVLVLQTVKDGWVRIDITDTGSGIAEEDLPFIWERYYKVDKTHKRAEVGTGLGLSIVKSVLEMHGARYGVNSTPGHGSTFWFALPLAEAPIDTEG